MSRIKNRGTKPELIIHRFLKLLKVKFKSHSSSILGRPDFFIKDLNLVIEVHGCFWHAHQGCKYFKMPSTNKLFWKKKISANVLRDKKIKKLLQQDGYRVCTIWECEVKDTSFLDKLLTALTKLDNY